MNHGAYHNRWEISSIPSERTKSQDRSVTRKELQFNNMVHEIIGKEKGSITISKALRELKFPNRKLKKYDEVVYNLLENRDFHDLLEDFLKSENPNKLLSDPALLKVSSYYLLDKKVLLAVALRSILRQMERNKDGAYFSMREVPIDDPDPRHGYWYDISRYPWIKDLAMKVISGICSSTK